MEEAAAVLEEEKNKETKKTPAPVPAEAEAVPVAVEAAVVPPPASMSVPSCVAISVAIDDARNRTEQQVVVWLASIGTAYADAKYSDAFVASGVTGSFLLDDIEEEDLLDLGVNSRLHRKRLMRAVVELRVAASTS
jgi:hypothetical protein